MQEDKEPVFDIVTTVKMSLQILPEMLQSLTVNTRRITQTLEEGFITATEVADYLVRQGVPFRTAHRIVGEVIRYSLDAGKTLPELSLEEYRQISEKFDVAVLEVITPQQAVNCKTSVGGTAPQNVFAAIQAAKRQLRIEN